MKKLLPLTLLLSLLLIGCGKEEPKYEPSPAPPIPATAAPAEETEAPAAAPTEFIPEGQEAVVSPTQRPAFIRALVRMASLDENGQERWYRTYEYDGQGRLLLEREVSSDGTETYRAEYAYGEHAHTITYTYMDGTTEQVTQTLDSQGRLLHQQTAAPGEMPYALLNYTYDQYGNQLTCQQSLDGTESTQSFTYTYTPDGKVATVEETMDGDFISRQEYHYDDRGRPAEVLYYDGSGLLYSTLHTWEGTTETVTTLDADDQVTIVSIHTYDSADGFGNLLRDETQQDGYVISCAEYTYEDIEISE